MKKVLQFLKYYDRCWDAPILHLCFTCMLMICFGVFFSIFLFDVPTTDINAAITGVAGALLSPIVYDKIKDRFGLLVKISIVILFTVIFIRGGCAYSCTLNNDVEVVVDDSNDS